MKNFIIVCFLTLSAAAFSQTREYKDENGKSLPGPEGAVYYRIIEPQGNIFLVRDYYVANDQLEMEATLSQVTPIQQHEGAYTSFYQNGQIKDQGEYKQNSKRGLWQSYHENGKLAEEIVHGPEKAIYNQAWDEWGKPKLIEGSGTFMRKNSRFGDQYTEILNSALIASYTIDEVSGDSIYVVVQETAEYKGGMEALYRFVGKTLRYPANARRYGIQGKVFVQFVIDKSGNARDVKVLKGIDGDADEEAARVIGLLNSWKPGRVKGKPVMQKMVLPVSFKLG